MTFYKPQNLTNTIEFNEDEEKFIDSIPKDYNDAWDGKLDDLDIPNAKKTRDELKLEIKNKLEGIQEPFCIYCGVHFEIVGVPEREHIAPKSKHPEFVFKPKNLALACHFCNGSSKKHNKETIEEKNEKYDSCVFNIIHPYMDKYEDHLEFNDNATDVIISPKNGSPKGKATIDMFGLIEPMQSALRAGAILRESKKLKVDEEKILDQIRTNKYLG